MGERKVLNKYYAPDFDPANVPRTKKPKNKQITIRMMLPMSVRCQTCGEYMYRGKKFNSRKETVEGGDYLGIEVFRFYMKCVRCSAEFTIRTDPKNADYVTEHGVSRNFEPWKQEDAANEYLEKKKEDEEAGDAMRALENLQKQSMIEMDNLDALDELLSRNGLTQKVSHEDLLAELEARKKKQAEAEVVRKLNEDDEALIKAIYGGPASDGRAIRRLRDDADDTGVVGESSGATTAAGATGGLLSGGGDGKAGGSGGSGGSAAAVGGGDDGWGAGPQRPSASGRGSSGSSGNAPAKRKEKRKRVGIKIKAVKNKKPKTKANQSPQQAGKGTGNALSLLAGYGASDSDDDDDDDADGADGAKVEA